MRHVAGVFQRSLVMTAFTNNFSASRGGRCSSHCHRGSAMTGTLIAVSITCVLAVAAYFAVPATLHARGDRISAIAAHVERHQEILDLIAGMIGASAEVISIHSRGETPYAEIVLRVSGDEHSITSGQIALICHSKVMRTITLYELPDTDESTAVLERDTMRTAGFRDRWRGNPEIAPRILATGISDMKLDMIAKDMLRIVLTWAPDSADGEDEASALIELTSPGGLTSAQHD